MFCKDTNILDSYAQNVGFQILHSGQDDTTEGYLTFILGFARICSAGFFLIN